MLFLTELRPPHVAPSAAPAQPAAAEPRAINPAGASEHKPALSFVEAPDAWWLTIEVPGQTADDLEITLKDDHLTVRGEKRLPQAEGLVWHHNERAQGAFERILKLPSGIDLERIEAETKHGLLTVRLAKAAAAVPQRIEILAR